MELKVYKGFSLSFLEKLDQNQALIDGELFNKVNVLAFDKELKRKLDISLKSLNQNDSKWVTYEEFSLIKDSILLSIDDYQLKVVVINNNLYADVFPIAFEIDEKVYNEIKQIEDNIDKKINLSKDAEKISEIYSSIFFVGNKYYGSFYNYEYIKSNKIDSVDYYKKQNIRLKNIKEETNLSIYINSDIESYLKTINEIIVKKPKTISIQDAGTRVSKRIANSICAYCKENSIQIVNYHEKLKYDNDDSISKELVDIAKKVLKIPGFETFRKIKFYKNPDINNEIIEISQDQIIKEIIKQAENSYNEVTRHIFRDVFLTAFTGAGKSVLFQIPAVYLAKKYKKLTIIIEPVIALMEDQKNALHGRGYDRVACFNSNLITQIDRENVLKKIKNGEIDILYLSPETLLSYSLETIIGDRELGLLIVDEAHIVTAWGYGFRPDYWYLGGYINKIRNITWSKTVYRSKNQHFPICAFTATAINGGEDDSVNETIISLFMENPIKYIGLVKRNDIFFNITVKEKNKLPTDEYKLNKGNDLENKVKEWILNKEKSIVYFPFASIINDAFVGKNGFEDSKFDSNSIVRYTGKNTENINEEEFIARKNESAVKFKNGNVNVMFATKAFGMGVDINDIKNVYHYAATGSLCDYVQEIGRAARKEDMNGFAITDFYENDSMYMQILFGISQIRNWQIDAVLSILYDTYKNKNRRNFLISPQSFSYIFLKNSSRNSTLDRKNKEATNSLKTCLLMLEKDFYDKCNFKVLISRPQSVFTKSYVCIKKEKENEVLNSKYGKSFTKVKSGRKDFSVGNAYITDFGDIYSIDLKEIWEKYYSNISFPQFKYFYFEYKNFYYGYKKYNGDNKIDVLEEIQPYIHARQKVTVKAKNNKTFEQIYQSIMDDLSDVNEILNFNFRKNGNKYFTADEFTKSISKRFGKRAKIIANTIFELIKFCNNRVVKSSLKNDKIEYFIPYGIFYTSLMKVMFNSQIFRTFKNNKSSECSHFIGIELNDSNEMTLKILSMFDYVSYEIVGGEQPEIFIRLNSPSLIENIVMGKIKYQNDYVKFACKKHDRDVKILHKFFTELTNDKERWEYIEKYFLGQDVINQNEKVAK